MKAAPLVILAGAAVCLAIAMADQYSGGDVYSEGSSLRTDRQGASVWLEALQKTGVTTARSYTPLNSAPTTGTILVLNYSPATLARKENTEVLEKIARAGARVFISMDDYLSTTEKIKAWDLEVQPDKKPEERSLDEDDEPAQWRNHLVASSSWHVFRSLSGQPIASERTFGKGSIAIAADTKPFLNLALRDNRDIALLDWARGPNQSVIFDESHLGSVEQGSIVGLMKRFRLQGVALTLFLASLLFVWRASVPFPPVPQTTADISFKPGTSSGDALRNLLGRRIAPSNLLRVCVDEWSRDFSRRAGSEAAREASRIADEQGADPDRWEKVRAVVRRQRTT